MAAILAKVHHFRTFLAVALLRLVLERHGDRLSRLRQVSCTLYEALVNSISGPDKADQIRVYLLDVGPYSSQAFAL